MKNKTIYIFAESFARDSRFSRLQEEAFKKNFSVEFINVYECLITDSSIFYRGRPIVLNENSISWVLGNFSTAHRIEELLKIKGGFIWPSAEAINFSDKFHTNYFLSHLSIPTPKTALVNTIKNIPSLAEYVGGFPCIIKKNNGTQGGFVELVNSQEEIISFIKKDLATISTIPLRKSSFLLQEFIKESSGTDYRVLCLKNKVLGIIKRSSTSSFKSNISLGGKAEFIEKIPELEKMAKKIMSKANLFYAGLDFVKSKHGWIAIEINTSAQFEGFEKATKINVAGEIINALLKMC